MKYFANFSVVIALTWIFTFLTIFSSIWFKTCISLVYTSIASTFFYIKPSNFLGIVKLSFKKTKWIVMLKDFYMTNNKFLLWTCYWEKGHYTKSAEFINSVVDIEEGSRKPRLSSRYITCILISSWYFKSKKIKAMFGSRKMREKENWEENGRKVKTKEMNIIFFTCLVIHGKFKGKKIKNSFSFVWLTTKKSKEKWKENKINNLS